MKTVFIEQSNEMSVFEMCYKIQRPLLLKGPTGCGKTQLVEYMAQKLSRPLIKVACNEDTNAADLLGRFVLKAGETIWQDGPVTQALRMDALLYLDELAEAREDVVVALHPLTDHRREVYLDKTKEVVKAGSQFMLIASYNPGYQHGLKEIKPSTRQRFVGLTLDYLNSEKEMTLLKDVTGVEHKVAHQLVSFANKIRQMKDLVLKETISTRLLINAALFIKNNFEIRQACVVTIAESLTDDKDTLMALKDLIHIHF